MTCPSAWIYAEGQVDSCICPQSFLENMSEFFSFILSKILKNLVALHPPISILPALKNALNCPLNWLLYGESTEIEPLESNSIDTSGLLSPEEACLLSILRFLDNSDRQCVYELADLLYRKTQRIHDLSNIADTDLHRHT